jgi:DNA-binding NarL/FixJ family response regulator
MLTLAPSAPRQFADAVPATGPGGCRVLVADDHPLYRQGITAALQHAGGFEVVAEATTGLEALRLIRELVPDIALLDVRMPELDGIDVVHALALHGPDIPVVMLSAFADAPLVDAALSAGAASYIHKGEDREVLCERLTTIAAHRELLGAQRLSPRDPLGHTGRWIPRVTIGEHQLLQLAGAGLTRAAIAEALDRDEGEVRAMVAAVSRKLDCDTLAEAVDRARAHGLIH